MSPQNIADALVGNLVTQIGQCSDDAIVTQPEFSRASFTTSSSITASTRGRPANPRFFEPSNL